jgi:signal transduction histidine kinase
MKFKDFIEEKIIQIILLIFALATIEIFLIMYKFAIFIKIYIPIIIFIMYFTGLLIEYLQKNEYYSNINNILDELEDKYLITEIINEPYFIEGKILEDILIQVNKSMIENVNKYKYLQEDYKEYIELWIHEIKIPLATSKMIIENNKSKVTENIDEELDKIENYIEQALFYARSNAVEKDYYIKKIKLQEIVNESIKRNKNILIEEKVILNLHDLENEVNTDNKWVTFILNQIIQNSVKYRKKDVNLQLDIYSEKQKENVILYIKDNGIGIKEGEINRIFEKGFTGTNGRISNKKSTGIGLYLCKNLCDKLGISIHGSSKEIEGTEISLIFPNSSFIDIN